VGGDRLVLCIADVGKERPTEVVARARDARVLLVFRRKK
jgi:hypothetical protein